MGAFLNIRARIKIARREDRQCMPEAYAGNPHSEPKAHSALLLARGSGPTT